MTGGGQRVCCPLPVQIGLGLSPVHVRPTHLLLSMKRCSVVNAMIRRTAVLTIILLWHMALIALVSYLGLQCGFPEVMWTTSTRRKRGKKAASLPGMVDTVETITTPTLRALLVQVVQFDKTFLSNVYIGERDISSPRRKKSVLKCVYVHSPFTVCVVAVKRWVLLYVYVHKCTLF